MGQAISHIQKRLALVAFVSFALTPLCSYAVATFFGMVELNDLLQYLGFFTFRDPVPAYKHNAAQFLHARGWIKTSLTYPGSPERADSDVEVLKDILRRLESM